MSAVLYDFTAGWATFGIALRAGVARRLQVGALPTQTDVKATYADGTIRHAIVTAKVPIDGSYVLTPSQAAAPTGSVTAEWPAVETAMVIDGVRYSAPMPALTEPWLQGPLVQEGRARAVPRTDDGTAHPFLRVCYDARTYANRARRLSVTIESMLDVAEMNVVTYDLTIAVNGDPVASRAAFTQYAFTRRPPIRVGLDGLIESTIVPDCAQFYAARALVPPLDGMVTAPTRDVSGPKFDDGQIGDLIYPMSAPGGRPEFGPYPAWVQQYLAHKRPDQLAYLLRMGELSGSWGMHITHPDGRSVTLDNVVSPTANQWTWGGGVGPVNKKVGRKWAPEIGSAHQPSFAFVPYLLTGDRYFLDEMRAWAHYCFMGWGPYGRRATEGIIAYQQTRGIGWALRDIADFVAYAPDDDVDTPYFRAKLQNNLRELDVQADTATDPLGSVRPTGSYIAKDAAKIQSQVPVWQNNYLAWGLHRAIGHHGLGPAGSTMRDKLVRYQVMLLTSAPDFDPLNGAEYWYYVTKHEEGNPPFGSLKEMHAYNFDPDPMTGQPRRPSDHALMPGYALDARLAMIVGIEMGLPGAREAYDLLMNLKFSPAYPATWGIKEAFLTYGLAAAPGRPEFAIALYEPPVPDPSPTDLVREIQSLIETLARVLSAPPSLI